MVSNQTYPRFVSAITTIINQTSIVSLLAASAQQWPMWQNNVSKLLVDNEIQLTLALQWVDKTPDAQRMLHDVECEWATMEPVGEVVDFPDVKEAIGYFCMLEARKRVDTPEASAFLLLVSVFANRG